MISFTPENSEKERRHPDGKRTLMNKTTEYLTHGERLPVDLYDNIFPGDETFSTSLREQYHASEAAYMAVVGRTFTGESCDTATTTEERLQYLKEAVLISKRVLMPGQTFNGASFIAEVECLLQKPDYIADPPVQETRMNSPDDLPALLAPTYDRLQTMHAKVFDEEIRPLVPEEVMKDIDTALVLSGSYLHRESIPEMLDAIYQEDGEAAYRKAIAELYYSLRIFLPHRRGTTSTAEEAQKAKATLFEDTHTTGDRERAINDRTASYKDSMRSALSAYTALRQHNYSPRECIDSLLRSAAEIGRLTTRTLDNTPGSLWYQGNKDSLSTLLDTTQYISVDTQNGVVSFPHIPPDTHALTYIDSPYATQHDFERDERQRKKHGQCPMRQRIEQCPPNIAYLVSELEKFGINAPIIRDDGSIQGGALVVVMSILAAEQYGLFKQLEKNPIFQDTIAKQPKEVQDYYAK